MGGGHGGNGADHRLPVITHLAVLSLDEAAAGQAVIFALKMRYGTGYQPPAATGTVFADMTDPNYYATSWAEKAYADGLISPVGRAAASQRSVRQHWSPALGA